MLPPTLKSDCVTPNTDDDGTYLFNLYVQPQEPPYKNDDIEGDNEDTQIQYTMEAEVSDLANNKATSTNVIGNNAEEQTETNMKGDNAQPTRQQITQGQNSDDNDEDITEWDNGNQSKVQATIENVEQTTSKSRDHVDTESSSTDDAAKNIDIAIWQLWEQEARKDLLYIPVKKMTTTDLYDLQHGPVDWDAIDPYSSLEEVYSVASSRDADHQDSTENKDKYQGVKNFTLVARQDCCTLTMHGSHTLI